MDQPAEEKSLGKTFVEKLEAQQEGLGPNFVEKVQSGPAPEEPIVESLRKRAGTASESVRSALSRLSTAAAQAAADAAPVVESWIGSVVGTGEDGQSLARAVQGIRVKDIAVPGAGLVIIEVGQKVKELEAVLRDRHIHGVAVWNGPAKRFEGSVDTLDLVTWASVKFTKTQLDAWSTFREENEYNLCLVQNIIDASMRDPFLSTTAETDVSAVLEAFRDRDVHRVFIRRSAEAEKDQLTGVLTQTDLIRFLHGAQFAAKEIKIGERIHTSQVITCYEDELMLSAFRLMFQGQVSSVGVVDARGKLIGCVSSFDILGQPTESVITFLFKSIKSFLSRDKANAANALVTIKPSNSFGELLEKMVSNKVSHVFVVDDDNFPTAVVTLKDVLKAIMK